MAKTGQKRQTLTEDRPAKLRQMILEDKNEKKNTFGNVMTKAIEEPPTNKQIGLIQLSQNPSVWVGIWPFGSLAYFYKVLGRLANAEKS